MSTGFPTYLDDAIAEAVTEYCSRTNTTDPRVVSAVTEFSVLLVEHTFKSLRQQYYLADKIMGAKTYSEVEVRKAIRDVDELSGPIPPELYEPLRRACISGDKQAVENTMRSVIKLAKHEVLQNLGLV